MYLKNTKKSRRPVIKYCSTASLVELRSKNKIYEKDESSNNDLNQNTLPINSKI